MIASLLLNAFIAYAETVKLSVNSSGKYNGKNVTAKYESTDEYTAFITDGEGDDFIFEDGSIYLAGSDGKKTDNMLGMYNNTVIFGQTYNYPGIQWDDDHMYLGYASMYICDGQVDFDPMGYVNNNTYAIAAIYAEAIVPSNCEFVLMKFAEKN